jgi:branched-chain amino acid transport system ATP-binding protein
MTEPLSNVLLKVQDLRGWYDESHVLHGIDFEVRQGEVVTLLGRNGAGKTSTLLAIMGILAKRAGSITFNGTEMISLQPRQIARLGMALCPEERGIFSSLSVEENLMLPPRIADGGLSVERIYDLFPNLYERRKSRRSRGSCAQGPSSCCLTSRRKGWHR